MMQAPALANALSILDKNESVKSRDENLVCIQARKGRCHSVWCPSCSKLEWAARSASDLEDFDWRKTREIVLTVDPGQFKDGKEAYDYVTDNKIISSLVRNLRRGKKVKVGKDWVWKYEPVKTTKYKTFLEWHKNGFPHWHVMVENEKSGCLSMIGQEMIHHYWPLARWIRETPIKCEAHWRKKIGYLRKHGYFMEDKEHQSRLPDWALNIPGLKIRRSNHSRRWERNGQDIQREDQDETKAWIIDPSTGRLLDPETVTYRRRLGLCGRCTFFRMYMGNKSIDGLFRIPYRKVRKDYPGEYRPGRGYLFSLKREEAEKLLPEMIVGEVIEYPKVRWFPIKKVIKHWCPVCGDRTYQKVKAIKERTDLYLCLRCKTVHEYKYREQESWRSPSPGARQKPETREHKLCPI